MKITAIVAVGRNLEIGKDNDLPWHLPADLQYFKRNTLGRHVLMGRKSYESIGRPLPGRPNVVITRNRAWTDSRIHIRHTIADALSFAKQNEESEVCIIGGAMIYEATQKLWDRLLITRVDTEVQGATAYFPDVEWDTWKLVSAEKHLPDAKNKFAYTFEVYER